MAIIRAYFFQNSDSTVQCCNLAHMQTVARWGADFKLKLYYQPLKTIVKELIDSTSVW